MISCLFLKSAEDTFSILPRPGYQVNDLILHSKVLFVANHDLDCYYSQSQVNENHQIKTIRGKY